MLEGNSHDAAAEPGKVWIASHSPGRLRLRFFPENATTPNLERLLQVPAITEVAYRKLTGSLVIQYDEELCSLEELLSYLRIYFPFLEVNGVPASSDEKELPKNLTSSVMYRYADLTNQTVHRVTAGVADLTSFLPLAFFTWAALDLLMRPSLPRWFELYREGAYLWHFYQDAAYYEK